VAAVVRAEVMSRPLSVSDFAAVLGIAESSAAARLRGETAFDLVEIEQVAAWLGLAPSELLARADELPH
jgi:hypothetical protein